MKRDGIAKPAADVRKLPGMTCSGATHDEAVRNVELFRDIMNVWRTQSKGSSRDMKRARPGL